MGQSRNTRSQEETSSASSPVLFMPAKLDTLAALRVVRAISASEAGTQVVVDFLKLGTLEPFAMLTVACAAREARERGVAFAFRNEKPHSYAAHMGLLAEFGPMQPPPTAVDGENERYIAIQTITRAQLHAEANDKRAAYVEDVIDEMSLRYARMLTQEDSSALVNALNFCLREVIRNAYEHSGAAESWFARSTTLRQTVSILHSLTEVRASSARYAGTHALQ